MKKLICIMMASLLMWACNSQKVSIDYDRNVDFSQIRTYHIDQNISTGLSELDQVRLLDALEKNFKFRGVKKAEQGDVEIKISPREYVSTNTASNVGVGIGTGGFSRIGGGISVGIPVASKRLNQEYTVSMYNQTGLIWEGILTLKMPLNASADVKQESIEKGVGKLLLNYPPKVK